MKSLIFVKLVGKSLKNKLVVCYRKLQTIVVMMALIMDRGKSKIPFFVGFIGKNMYTICLYQVSTTILKCLLRSTKEPKCSLQ